MVYSIGEALIDMIPEETGSIRYVKKFIKQAGGAPANVAAAVSKLGGQSAFISKVGGDGFGKFLIDVLKGCGVDVSKVFLSPDKFTGIVYIALKEDGEREFCASRNDSADLYLNEEEIEPSWFKKDDILHFCSVSLVEAPVKYAHKKAIESVIKAGGAVSFDPNLRLMLWKRKEDLINTVFDFMKYPDYLKISDDEMKVIFNGKDFKKGIKKFFEIGERLKFIILSKGEKGSEVFFRDGNSFVQDAYISEVVDSTGAGDCFIGSILFCLDLLKREPHSEELKEIINFASAAASLKLTKKGAIEGLPNYKEVVYKLKTKN